MVQYTAQSKGDATAMVDLANKYYMPPTMVGADMGKPIEGMQRNADKAVVWAKKAAALAAARRSLGYIYEDIKR